MTSINRTGSASVLPGADLESAINDVLQETNNVASQMAQDVVQSIKQNNQTLKTLRDLKAAVREKDSGLLNQILDANPEIKKALGDVVDAIGGSSSKSSGTKTPSLDAVRADPLKAVQDNVKDFFSNPIGTVEKLITGSSSRPSGTSSSAQTAATAEGADPWSLIASRLDDLVENFNSFGQEAQLGLQNFVSRVTQSFTALSNVSSKFSSTGDGIIGNIRG